MSTATKPQNIIVDVAQQLLQINWQDGHSSVYELRDLRRADVSHAAALNPVTPRAWKHP